MIQTMREADAFQNLAGGGFRLRPIVASEELRHHRILKRRKFRQKMMELKDKSDVTVPESGQLRSGPFEDIFAVKEHFPAGWRIQSPQKMEQCAFSST